MRISDWSSDVCSSDLFVAMPASADGLLVDVLERLSMLPVHVRLLPAVASMEFPNRPISTIAGMPVIHVSDKPISGWKRFMKVAEDLTVASLVLLLFLPVFLLIAEIGRAHVCTPVTNAHLVCRLLLA